MPVLTTTRAAPAAVMEVLAKLAYAHGKYLLDSQNTAAAGALEVFAEVYRTQRGLRKSGYDVLAQALGGDPIDANRAVFLTDVADFDRMSPNVGLKLTDSTGTITVTVALKQYWQITSSISQSSVQSSLIELVNAKFATAPPASTAPPAAGAPDVQGDPILVTAGEPPAWPKIVLGVGVVGAVGFLLWGALK